MKLKNSEMIEKDAISDEKSLIKSIINNFREKLNILGSKILKNKSKTMRKTIYLKEKVINNDDDLDDSGIENISTLLNNLEKYLFKESRHYDHDTKYKGIENIRYLFDEDENKDYYKPKLINTAFKNNSLQYQTGSDRTQK